MSALLIEKLRKSREKTLEAHGHTFILRRPAEVKLVEHFRKFQAGEESRLDLVRRCVVGWDLTEADLINGGTPDPVEFLPALFGEWLDDNSEYWEPLTTGLLEMIAEFNQRREAAAKN